MLEPKPASPAPQLDLAKLKQQDYAAGDVANSLSKVLRRDGDKAESAQATSTPNPAEPSPTPQPVPIAPTVERTPTPAEIRAQIAAHQEQARAQAAAAEAARRAAEDAAWMADPLGYTMAEAAVYYEDTYSKNYGTTLAEIVAKPIPADNPLGDKEIYPGLEPVALTDFQEPLNAQFLVRLNLDPARISNYDPVYLAELKSTYSETYHFTVEHYQDVVPVEKGVEALIDPDTFEIMLKLRAYLAKLHTGTIE